MTPEPRSVVYAVARPFAREYDSTVRRHRSVLVVLVAAVFVAVVGTASVASASSAARQGALLGEAGSGSCSREVDLGGRHYRYGRLPRGSIRAGAKLRNRASLQCEPRLVCRMNQSCFLSPGKVSHKIIVRRIRGVSVSLALIDAASRRVYFNRAIFLDVLDPKHLLQQLRRRGGPRPGGPQYPPNSYLPAIRNAKVRLAHGDYCWSSPAANGQFVQACATMVPPWMRFDLPLVAAEPGASPCTWASRNRPTFACLCSAVTRSSTPRRSRHHDMPPGHSRNICRGTHTWRSRLDANSRAQRTISSSTSRDSTH